MATSLQHTASGSASDWIERFARIGYAAKGAVYLIVGFVSAQAAFQAGQATGSKGALRTVLDEPFGQVLLGLLAVGLAGYAAWRFVQATVDPEDKGSDGEGIATRAMYFVSGLLHVSLVVFAVRLLMGGGSSSSGGGTEQKTAQLMSEPFGRWLVGLGGLVIIGWAIYQLYKAYTIDLSDRLDLSPLSSTARTWAVRAGRAGIGARGVVFTIVGGFFLLAAWNANPQKAQGLADSLRWLESQPYGPWLMALTAVGLACYGAYMLVKSRYRRIA